MTSTADRAAARDRGFFGHPRALSTLYFTEMWERFSYYGMRAILALYLYTEVQQGGLGLSIPTATSVVAAYGASVYLTGVFGGWAADRLLGPRRLVAAGGVLIMLGHVGLTLPGGLATVPPSLLAIILGTGLLKPNISTMVGDLYDREDARRDAGFSLFYMSINLGGFLGQLVASLLAEEAGFHYGFGAAAVGMALGLAQYVLGRRGLSDASRRPANPLQRAERGRVLRLAGLVGGGLVAVFAVLGALGHISLTRAVDLVTVVSAVAPVVYFAVILRSPKVDEVERDRVIAYIPLFLATVLFFLLAEQSATTLLVVADQRTETEVFGLDFPPGWFQSINPLAVVVLAPLFALLWLRLGHRQPSAPAKMAVGLVILGFGYLWVLLAGLTTGDDGRLDPLMFGLVFVILTLGELLISPVGLSMTTKIAPRAFASQALGLYFLAPALGQGIGAQVVRWYGDGTHTLYFGITGAATLAAAALFAFGIRNVKRRLHGVQ